MNDAVVIAVEQFDAKFWSKRARKSPLNCLCTAETIKPDAQQIAGECVSYYSWPI